MQERERKRERGGGGGWRREREREGGGGMEGERGEREEGVNNIISSSKLSQLTCNRRTTVQGHFEQK